MDNYYTGTKQNIAGLLSDRGFKPVYDDVVFPLDLQVDEIFNLACAASPVHYQRHPIQTAKTSVHGAVNILDLAVRLGAKVLQTSTSEVYGDPLVHPQNEDYWGNVNPVGRRSCYDEGKRCAETLFFDYHRQYALDVRIARVFNTYGPRMHPKDGRVVSNFIVQALTGEPITIYGDGSQTRSFCYVRDLVDALLLFMKAQPTDPGPLNLGNPGEFTVLELAEMVLRLTRSSSRLVLERLPDDDPKRRRPDISRAKSLLGWEPRVPLEEGLKETIRYFQKIFADENVFELPRQRRLNTQRSRF